jgi:hypothetical protein
MSPTPDMGPTLETCKTDNMPVKLEAHYGVKGALNVNIKVPSDCTDACILDKDAVASIYLLADVTQNGQSAMVTATPCKIVIPPVALKGQPMPTTLTAPDSLVQTITPVSSTAAISGANTCSGLLSMPIPILLGTRLTAPATDPLPLYDMSKMPQVALCGGMASVTCDAATDFGCICDQEADGKPGATVGASGVPAFDDVDQVYLGLRTVVQLDGSVFPPSPGQTTPGQRLKGNIAGLKLEQSPVGCHHTPGGGGAPYDCTPSEVNSVAMLNPLVTQSVNNKSTFVGMPVPAGYTCSQLIADAPTLFKGQ